MSIDDYSLADLCHSTKSRILITRLFGTTLTSNTCKNIQLFLRIYKTSKIIYMGYSVKWLDIGFVAFFVFV